MKNSNIRVRQNIDQISLVSKLPRLPPDVWSVQGWIAPKDQAVTMYGSTSL